MIWTDWFQSWFYFLCHSHNNNSITTGRFEQLTKGRRQKQELGTTTKLRTSLGATARRQRSKMKTELWRTFIERVVNEFISHWVLLFLGIQYMTEILDCYHNTDSTFHVNLRCWRTSKNFGEPLTEPAWTSWLRRQTFLMALRRHLHCYGDAFLRRCRSSARSCRRKIGFHLMMSSGKRQRF